MNRSKTTLLPYEVDILHTAYGADEGVYAYGLAKGHYDTRGMVSNGTVYKRLRVLEEMGMIEKGEPIRTENLLAPRRPYHLTVLGVLALCEAEPNLPDIKAYEE